MPLFLRHQALQSGARSPRHAGPVAIWWRSGGVGATPPLCIMLSAAGGDLIILCTSDTRSLDHATQISVVILSMTQTVRTLAQQRDVASAALDAGGRRKTATSFEWDVAGKCEKPVPVELVGRPSAPLIVVGRNIANAKTVVVSPSKPVPLFIDL